MVLSYWGWQGSQFETRAYLRPSFESDDKNVNPFEIVEYVQNYTQFDALWRVGGRPGNAQAPAGGWLPGADRKGTGPADDAWLGHYQILSGYDDAKGSSWCTTLMKVCPRPIRCLRSDRAVLAAFQLRLRGTSSLPSAHG